MASTIYVQQTNNRMRFAERITNMFHNEMKDQKKIFVKPNIVSSEWYPTTTHPDVLRYVLKNLPKEADIIIADGPAIDAGSSEKIIKNHYLQKVCNQFGFELQNLYDFGFKKIRVGSGFYLHVSKLALESDYMISLPVMKTHCIDSIGITGALKNNFGLLSARDRYLLHAEGALTLKVIRKILGKKSEKPIRLLKKLLRIKHDINIAIAELNVIRKPELFIIDMVDTLINANEVRHGGIQKHVGLMFAGKDPVALDSFGLEQLVKIDFRLKGKKPEDIPQIYYAKKMGVGDINYRVKTLQQTRGSNIIGLGLNYIEFRRKKSPAG